MALQWLHIQWNTFGTWLPGDPRGFRNHQHRIHSSGEYKNPPPAGEHAGLRNYAARVMHRDAVRLDAHAREIALRAIVEKALSLGLDLRAVAVCASHVHLVAEIERDQLSQTVGKLKRHSSRRCYEAVPGRMWAARQHAVLITNRDQFVTAVRYVLAHRSENGAVWAKHLATQSSTTHPRNKNAR